MSATSALELLEKADLLTRQLRHLDTPTTTAQWESFDTTLHRLLIELVGIDTGQVRTADPAWRHLDLAIRTYPAPLRPPLGQRLSPAQAARYADCTIHALRARWRDGHLPALKDGGAHTIASSDLDTRSDIRPADPADPHPLAQIACTLGAMADLVHEARTHGPDVLGHDGEAAGAVQHVLALAAVAARHTLAHGELDAADRPLLIARYAGRVIDSLRDVASQPLSLDLLASIAPAAHPATLAERLESHLHAWHRTARAELDQLIPSIEALRQIANQGAHLCAVRAALEAGPTHRAGQLHEAAQALAQGEKAWDKLTTLSRPSHEFVTSSRELYETLTVISKAAQHPALNTEQAKAHIDRGLEDIANLMAATRTLPERLMSANILRAPAATIRSTDDRLRARKQGHYVQVRPADVPDLHTKWQDATAGLTQLRSAARAIEPTSLFP